MKLNMKFGISALLVAMLLLSMVFVPAVSASTDIDNINNIVEYRYNQFSEKEKDIIDNALKNKSSKEDQEKAEEILDELDKMMKIETENSRKQLPVKTPIQVFLPNSTEVTALTTLYYDSANDGDSYYSTTGFYTVGGADYSLNDRKAREAVLGGSGLGWGSARALVGQRITVTGSSRTVNIAMDGYAQAYAAAAGGGSARTKVIMGLYDETTQTEYDSVIIFDESVTGAGYAEIDESFNVGNTHYLETGHSYLVYLEVIGSEATVGAAYACTDAGPGDGDDWGYVEYDYFTISW